MIDYGSRKAAVFEESGRGDHDISLQELVGRLSAFRAVAARKGGEYGRWASAQATVLAEEIGRTGRA